jgi:hypothetical protein
MTEKTADRALLNSALAVTQKLNDQMRRCINLADAAENSGDHEKASIYIKMAEETQTKIDEMFQQIKRTFIFE